MLAALLLPGLLDRLPERRVMIAGALTMIGALLALALSIRIMGPDWAALLIAWAIIGIGYSTVLTPSGRLLRRSAHPEDRPAVFASMLDDLWLIQPE